MEKHRLVLAVITQPVDSALEVGSFQQHQLIWQKKVPNQPETINKK